MDVAWWGGKMNRAKAGRLCVCACVRGSKNYSTVLLSVFSSYRGNDFFITACLYRRRPLRVTPNWDSTAVPKRGLVSVGRSNGCCVPRPSNSPALLGPAVKFHRPSGPPAACRQKRQFLAGPVKTTSGSGPYYPRMVLTTVLIGIPIYRT